MTIHVSLSGGMDSTALLAWVLSELPGEPVRAVGFDYGQRHRRELESAANVADHFGVPFDMVALPRLSSPALTDGQDVPHGHYTDESMAVTVVKGRNMLFAANLVARAQPGDVVAVGVHAGDHAQYPDCRPEFWVPFAQAVRNAYGVTVLAPFLNASKEDIAAVGQLHHAPFHLSWSCYEGGAQHCGRCGTCVERAEAFHLAGVPDPTPYADTEFWKEAVANA